MSTDTVLNEIPVELPCGCRVMKRTVNGERQFVMAPCSTKCPNLEAAMGIAGSSTTLIDIVHGELDASGKVIPS